jgi:hypothetical protein
MRQAALRSRQPVLPLGPTGRKVLLGNRRKFGIVATAKLGNRCRRGDLLACQQQLERHLDEVTAPGAAGHQYGGPALLKSAIILRMATPPAVLAAIGALLLRADRWRTRAWLLYWGSRGSKVLVDAVPLRQGWC